MEDVEKISIFQSVGLEYNVDRLNQAVFNQYGNMIDCALEIYGSDRFFSLLEQRQSRPNPKYEELKLRFKLAQERPPTELAYYQTMHERGFDKPPLPQENQEWKEN